MSLTRQIERLVRRAFPGFPEHQQTRLGVVVAIPDPPDAEKATDRFRPRYAVDVQLLTPGGQPDTGRPVLQGLPLPAFGTGDGRGFFAFPDVGTRVRIGYDYGLPTHPYIAAVLPEGRALPPLLPGELLVQHSAGAFIRFDAKGNLTIQTDGELREDSQVRTIEADATTESHGTLAHQVDGDWSQSVGGRLVQEILGALKQTVGGDVRVAVLGSYDQTVAGDRGELVGGKLEITAGLDVTITSALGNFKVRVTPGVGTISIGNGVIDLPTILDAVLTQLQAETHQSPAGPTLPPLNAALYLLEQIKLATIKS